MKYIKYYIIINYTSLSLLFLINFNCVQAQNSILSTGGKAAGAGGSVNYSVGQVFFINASSVNGSSISQGVQQPIHLNALPITLVLFQATAVNNEKVLVQWQTSSEISNKYFTVEKSKDGILFAPAQTVETAGRSSIIKAYSWIDLNPYDGVSYYRLKQTDNNNGYSYSIVRVIDINSLLQSITIFPNPAHDILNVKMDKKETLTCNIFDLAGRLISTTILIDLTNDIDVSALQPATYIIQFINGKEAKQFKLIKN